MNNTHNLPGQCPTCGHTEINEDVKQHVVTLYRQGLVQKEIALQLGISQPYVSRILKQQVATVIGIDYGHSDTAVNLKITTVNGKITTINLEDEI